MKNINTSKPKNFILNFSRSVFFSFPFLLAATSSNYSLNAETESFLPAEMIAGPGESKNNSLTTGTRASLSLGTSSSFGSSANVSSTDAYKLDAVSAFVPTSGSWTSTFGAPTDTNTAGGVIKANVGNIRSSGPGTLFDNLESNPIETSSESSSDDSNDSSSTITPADSGNGYSINATDATTAEGEATLEGVKSDIVLELNPESTFTSTTITYLEGNSDDNAMATANGAANLGLNNALNVDLSNTAFTNAFSQAF